MKSNHTVMRAHARAPQFVGSDVLMTAVELIHRSASAIDVFEIDENER